MRYGGVNNTQGYGGVTVPRSPYVLGQTALPCILPSSGSIGNNGALTLTTALPVSASLYTACYQYFPANAIVAGSAAGLYFVTMSSTTLGTIFNNVYDPSLGVLPTIPASPTAFVTTGPGAYTQTTGAELTLVGLTVPSNSLGPNGKLTISGNVTTPSTAGTKRARVLYSTVALFDLVITTSGARQQLIKSMANRGVTNRQFIDGNNAANLLNGTADFIPGAIDTTAAQLLTATANHNTATDYTIFESLQATIAYAP